ncbi:MAG: ATP-dependent zinc protease [Simkaniaceae bacterium]|nr:MAG: ATP-dependent zinc protease [Simkaniaceae bacterium]
MDKKEEEKLHIGWQEWVSLPGLKIPAIKAKIDTGAKTSSLHAFNTRPVVKNKRDYVKFYVHPIQRNNTLSIPCCCPIFDIRNVMSSNGQVEERYVIKSLLNLGTAKWEIEITLSDRDPLRFRMLLGREALSSNVVIDPSKTVRLKKYSKNEIFNLYY